MKQSTVFVLLAVLLCCAVTFADAQAYVYASTCARCKSIGASYCGYGTLRTKGVSCDGQRKIGSCADCERYGGRCVSSFITECYV